MLNPGDIFADRYVVSRVIGKGSFGTVYQVDDLQTQQSLAIKVLHPRANADQELRHRLRREAQLARQINSPYCVQILDVDQSADGRAYVAMEYLNGEELRELFERTGPLPPERIAGLAREVLEALEAIHAQGIIHRDLKPNNIFICRDEQGAEHVKLLDFGIAKIAGRNDGKGLSETTKLTGDGNILGTPTYMSPEQCRGAALTPASDLYSLGIVLYELVTGRPPFHDPNPIQVMMQHNDAPVPSLPDEVASTRLGRAIQCALAKNVRDRFQSAAEFRAALSGGIASKAVERQVAPEKPPANEAGTVARTPAKVDAPRVPTRSWKGLIPVIVIVVLVAVAILSQALTW